MKLLMKWLVEGIDDSMEDDELVFEIVPDEAVQRDGENVATGQDNIPEIRIKEEYH